MRQHSERVKPRSARPAQIVRPERRRDPLALAPPAEPRLYAGVCRRPKDEPAGLILTAQQRERLARERHPVCAMIFRVFLRDVPALAEHVRPGTLEKSSRTLG